MREFLPGGMIAPNGLRALVIFLTGKFVTHLDGPMRSASRGSPA
jgi:hypothetical protein